MLKILFYITLFAATLVVANDNCEKWFKRLDEYVKIMPIKKIGEEEYYCFDSGKSCYVPRDRRARTKIRDIAMEFYAISNFDALYEVARCYENLVEFVCIEDVQLTVVPNENCEKWISDLKGRIKLVPWEYRYEKAVEVSLCGKNQKVWYSQNSETNKKIAEIAKKKLKVSDDEARYEVTKCYVDAAAYLCIKEETLCEKWMDKLEEKIIIVPDSYSDKEAVYYCHGKGSCRDPRHNDSRFTIAEIAKKHLEISDHDALNVVAKCYEDAASFVCLDDTSFCVKWLNELEAIIIFPKNYDLVTSVHYCLGRGSLWSTNHPDAHKKIAEIAKKNLEISDHDALYEVTKCYQDQTNFICIEDKDVCEKWINELRGTIKIIPKNYDYEKSVTYCLGKGVLWPTNHPEANEKFVEIAKNNLEISDHKARNEVAKCYVEAADFVCIKEKSICEKWMHELRGAIKVIPQEYDYDKCVSYCLGKGTFWPTNHPEAHKKISEIAKKYLEFSDRDARNEVAKCYADVTEFVCIKEISLCEQWMIKMEEQIKIIPRKYDLDKAISYCRGRGWWLNARHPEGRKKIAELVKKYLKMSDRDSQYKVVKCYDKVTDFVCMRETTYEKCAKWFNKLEDQIKIIPETYTDEEAFSYCRKYGRNFWYHHHHEYNEQILVVALSHIKSLPPDDMQELAQCYGDFSKHTCIEESCAKWTFELKTRNQIFVVPHQYSRNDNGLLTYHKAAAFCHGTQKCMSPWKVETHKKIVEIAKKYLMRMPDDVVLSEVVKCFQDTQSFLCIEMN